MFTKRFLLLFLLMVLARPLVAQDANEAVWRLLLVHSYGRDFAPFDSVDEAFRSELSRRVAGPVEFYDVSLDTARWARTEEGDDIALKQYLQARFVEHRPDLVVTFGGPATRFLLGKRQELFPSVPVLIAGVDPRMIGGAPPDPRDVVVTIPIDHAAIMKTMLAVRPRTRHVMIVVGASAHERMWRAALERELRPFADKIKFTWTTDMSLEQICKAAAALPADGAILYRRLAIDGAGVPQEQAHAMQQIYAAAKVPMFGEFDRQLGHGIVGGPLISLSAVGIVAAEAAMAMRAGSPPPDLARREVRATRLVFDWRELERWKIPPEGLPAGSVVEFQPVDLWERYAVLVILGIAVIVLQAAFIVALSVQHRRRKHAEQEARDLNKRLLSANEDERSRLARELHDDFSHRLARLSFDAAQLEQELPTVDAPRMLHGMRQELSRLSEDIHAVSHQLHPSVLEDLGLVDALRTEGEHLSRSTGLDVVFDVDDVRGKLPSDVALCAFRVTQEALRNIVRHAQATAVNVSARTRNGHLHVAIRDNGIGFDPNRERAQPHASVGHASMRERVRVLGGVLKIRSVPGNGTTIETHIPLNARAS